MEEHFRKSIGSLDLKITTVVPSVQQKNKLNDTIFLFIVRLLIGYEL